MSDDNELKQKLLEKIKSRRVRVNSYIKNLEQHGSRLTNLSIICTAITAVLTAGPALGRDNFVQLLQNIFKVQDAAVWGTLCLLAMLLSITAAIANNMNKPQNLADRLVRAQASSALLEKLETSLELEQMPVAEATKLYQQHIGDITFIQ